MCVRNKLFPLLAVLDNKELEEDAAVQLRKAVGFAQEVLDKPETGSGGDKLLQAALYACIACSLLSSADDYNGLVSVASSLETELLYAEQMTLPNQVIVMLEEDCAYADKELLGADVDGHYEIDPLTAFNVARSSLMFYNMFVGIDTNS